MQKLEFRYDVNHKEFDFICSKYKLKQMKRQDNIGYMTFFSYHSGFVSYFSVPYTFFEVSPYFLLITSRDSSGKTIKITVDKNILSSRKIEYRHSFRRKSYLRRKMKEKERADAKHRRF